MNCTDKLAKWTTDCLIQAGCSVVNEIRERLPLGVELSDAEAFEMKKEVVLFTSEKLTKEHPTEYQALCRTKPKFNEERFYAAFSQFLDGICPRNEFHARFVVPGFSTN